MSYFTEFNNDGIPFMDGRSKGDRANILNKPLHIVDYGFIKGTDGEFAVMLFDEYPDQFYFGNSIVTEMLKTVSADNMKKHLREQAIIFTLKVSKKTKREYMAFRFDEPDSEKVPF